MLKTGEIVKLSGALFRVAMVNPCRARIVPLSKRHVVLDDGTEFDAADRGRNISPNSPLEVVTDLEQARDEIELAATERELALAKAELAREARRAAAPPPAAPTAAKAPPPRPVAARSGAGWRVGPAGVPGFKAGTLAAQVIAYILAHPGSTTKDVVAGVPSTSAVGACVSRFFQAGFIEKV